MAPRVSGAIGGATACSAIGLSEGGLSLNAPHNLAMGELSAVSEERALPGSVNRPPQATEDATSACTACSGLNGEDEETWALGLGGSD